MRTLCSLFCSLARATAVTAAVGLSNLCANDLVLNVYEDQSGKLEYRYNEQSPTLPEGRQQLTWITSAGMSETIYEKPVTGRGVEKPEQIFREGDKFAIVTGSSLGVLEYHLYQRSAGKWNLLAFSPLGGPPPDAAGAKLNSLTDFQITKSEHGPLNLSVTNLPLLPDSDQQAHYRLVTSEGQAYHPRGITISGAIWDQPLEKILKDHEARKGAPFDEPSKPPATKPVPVQLQQTSPVSSAKLSPPTQSPTKPESSSFSLMIIGGVILLGMAGLAYRLKRGRK